MSFAQGTPAEMVNSLQDAVQLEDFRWNLTSLSSELTADFLKEFAKRWDELGETGVSNAKLAKAAIFLALILKKKVVKSLMVAAEEIIAKALAIDPETEEPLEDEYIQSLARIVRAKCIDNTVPNTFYDDIKTAAKEQNKDADDLMNSEGIHAARRMLCHRLSGKGLKFCPLEMPFLHPDVAAGFQSATTTRSPLDTPLYFRAEHRIPSWESRLGRHAAGSRERKESTAANPDPAGLPSTSGAPLAVKTTLQDGRRNSGAGPSTPTTANNGSMHRMFASKPRLPPPRRPSTLVPPARRASANNTDLKDKDDKGPKRLLRPEPDAAPAKGVAKGYGKKVQVMDDAQAVKMEEERQEKIRAEKEEKEREKLRKIQEKEDRVRQQEERRRKIQEEKDERERRRQEEKEEREKERQRVKEEKEKEKLEKKEREKEAEKEGEEREEEVLVPTEVQFGLPPSLEDREKAGPKEDAWGDSMQVDEPGPSTKRRRTSSGRSRRDDSPPRYNSGRSRGYDSPPSFSPGPSRQNDSPPRFNSHRSRDDMSPRGGRDDMSPPRFNRRRSRDDMSPWDRRDDMSRARRDDRSPPRFSPGPSRRNDSPPRFNSRRSRDDISLRAGREEWSPASGRDEMSPRGRRENTPPKSPEPSRKRQRSPHTEAQRPPSPTSSGESPGVSPTPPDHDPLMAIAAAEPGPPSAQEELESILEGACVTDAHRRMISEFLSGRVEQQEGRQEEIVLNERRVQDGDKVKIETMILRLDYGSLSWKKVKRKRTA
ncbi:hypothetical protein HK097_008601, partial [Rhizophlyctis rosea]